MKIYTDYMDHISVDAALHGKIMERITPASRPPRRNRAVRRHEDGGAAAAQVYHCGAAGAAGVAGAGDWIFL